MSSGQKTSHHHSQQLVNEVKHYLDDKRIMAYLKRPYRVDRSKSVLYTGGSSVDGRTYYIDPDLPDRFVRYVLWHERVEKALREVLPMSYPQAHKLATAAERDLVEQSPDPMSWAEYSRAVDPIVRKNEHRREIPTVPKGFDLGPYKESHDAQALRTLRHARVAG